MERPTKLQAKGKPILIHLKKQFILQLMFIMPEMSIKNSLKTH